ncbi:MAG: TrkH family potassium uptake protein [Cyanobacteria bacterium J06648_16]
MSRRTLRQRYRLIVGYTGLIGLIIGAVMLMPLLALLFYPNEGPLAWGFWLPGGILMGVGLVLWRSLPHPATGDLSLTDAAVIVLLAWLLAIAAGTVPFMAVGGLSLTQAVFESTSGWTTTGLSVVDVERASHVLLLFRSLAQLFGGAGFAIVALSAIAGPLATELPTAEGRTEQLVPNIQRSAKWVLRLYAAYVGIGFGLLRWAGMDTFDALNHAFAALSTGGFSTRYDSIASWQQPAVEWVTIGLMLLGSLNYVTSYLALTGQFRAVWRNSELRMQVYLVGIAVALLAVTRPAADWDYSWRTASFAVVTSLSTTGFSTADYSSWQGLGQWLTVLLMMVGGHTGSTAGGLKLYRIYVLYQAILWEIKRQFLPAHAITEVSLWQGEVRRFLNDRQLLKICLYVILYLVVLAIGTGVLTAYGNALQSSLFEYVSALSTVGLSVGITRESAPLGVLWVEIVGMLLGRLEITVVLVGALRIARDASHLRD